MNRSFLVALYVWGLFFFIPYATADKLKFRSLKIEDGLPYNAVRSITSDHQGYIWIGTELGLARYDGLSVTSYLSDAQNPNSLTANYIKQLTTDDSGQLWLSSGKGISRYQLDSNNFQHWQKENGKANSLSSNRVQSFVEDQKGNFWIATDKGLDKFDPVSGNFEHYSYSNSILSDLTIRSLLVEQDQLYIGTNKGLFIRSNDGEVRSVQIVDGRQPVVRTLIKSDSGEIWFGTHEGLFAFQPKSEMTRRIKLNGKVKYILSLLRDDQNNIWVGTFDWGLFRVDKNETILNFRPDKSDAMSLADKTVLSLHQDPSGIIWAGTYNHGLSYFDPLQLTFGSHDNSLNSLPCLSSSDIRSAKALDNETVMLGTLQGATLFNLSTKQCQHFNHEENQENTLSDNEVFAIETYDADTVWLGTGRGLDKLSLKDGVIVGFGNLIENSLVFDIVQDENFLYLATNRGVYQLDLNTEKSQKMTSPATSSLVASVLTKVSTGLIYVGTNKGLFKIDKQQNELEAVEFGDNFGLSKSVYSLSIAEKSDIYFTVEEEGLFHWNPDSKALSDLTKRWKIPVTEGFTGIYKSNSEGLWITTVQKGIYYRDLKQNTTTNYRSVDGLVSDVFNLGAVAQFPDGRWLFGNREGFNLFDPNLIKVNLNPPLVSLSDMTLNGKQVSYSKSESRFSLDTHISKSHELNLSFREPVFGFDILATHYVEPSKLEYKYRLLGLNSDWITLTSQQRSVAFSNLAPGEYKFELTAITSKGVESQRSVELSISVATPPWKTWWAYTLYVVLLLAVLISTYWIRTRSLRNQALLLQKKVDSRTKQLNQEKEKIEEILDKKKDEIANVSHEFRTPLTLILGPLKRVSESMSDESLKPQLSLIQRNAYRLLRMVEQLLSLETFRVRSVVEKRKQPVSQSISLIANSFVDLCRNKNVTMIIDSIDEAEFDFADDGIERIILNLLSNAYKYTNDGDRISLAAIKRPNNQYQISIEDTGMGIPEKDQARVFERYARANEQMDNIVRGTGIGLALVKALVELHQGSIALTSELGKGTSVVVSLPMTNKSTVDSLKRETIMTNELVDLELIAINSRQTSSEFPTETSQTVDKPTVLVVEDEPDMLEYIRGCLSENFLVLVATNGSEGINIAQKEVPDLVVSDVMMPVMDGYNLTRAIRESAATDHIPVVLLTAKSDIDSRMKGWQYNADEYLSKPFNKQELILRLQNLLDIRELLRSAFREKLYSSRLKIEFAEQENRGDLSAKFSNSNRQFLKNINSKLEFSYSMQGFKISQLAKMVDLSERQLARKIRALLGITPTEYLRRFRLEKAKSMLQQGKPPSSVWFEVGFSSHSHFTQCFKTLFDCTPTNIS